MLLTFVSQTFIPVPQKIETSTTKTTLHGRHAWISASKVIGCEADPATWWVRIFGRPVKGYLKSGEKTCWGIGSLYHYL